MRRSKIEEDFYKVLRPTRVLASVILPVTPHVVRTTVDTVRATHRFLEGAAAVRAVRKSATGLGVVN